MNLIQNPSTPPILREKTPNTSICVQTHSHTQTPHEKSGQFPLHWEALQILTLEPEDFKFQRNGKKREYQIQGDVFCGLPEKLHLWPCFQAPNKVSMSMLKRTRSIALRSLPAHSSRGSIAQNSYRGFSLDYSSCQRPH